VGGMGEVYRARDTKLNREVALKVLPDNFALDPDRLARVRREAQVLASLNHPNIGVIQASKRAAGRRPWCSNSSRGRRSPSGSRAAIVASRRAVHGDLGKYTTRSIHSRACPASRQKSVRSRDCWP
jgi:serine/threonine protein kinase